MCGGVHDIITSNKFHQNRSRGFRATGVWKSGSPIDLACRPYNSSALPCWLWSGYFEPYARCRGLTRDERGTCLVRVNWQCISPRLFVPSSCVCVCVDDRQGSCYVRPPSTMTDSCHGQLGVHVTRPTCCCTVGAGWTVDTSHCQPCPHNDTGTS